MREMTKYTRERLNRSLNQMLETTQRAIVSLRRNDMEKMMLDRRNLTSSMMNYLAEPNDEFLPLDAHKAGK